MPEPAHEQRLDAAVPFAVSTPAARHRTGKPAHHHPEGQLAMIADGLLVVDVEGGSWMIPAGRIGWIPPGLVHAATSFGATVGWTLHVQPSLCERLPAIPTIFRTAELTAALFNRIAAWTGQDRELTDRQYRLIHVFLDELETAEPESLCLPVPRDRRLRMMAAAIAADPSSKESLASWGARIGMSERGLTRQFRVETGMSFVQWRSMARMKRALEMLAGGATVTDTALDLGYDSASSFIALFRRTFGVTPARQGFPQSGGSRPLQRPYGG
jgi:AraC-like DNA-binding protein